MNYLCTYKDIFEIIQDHFQLSLDAPLEILEEKSGSKFIRIFFD